MAGEDLVCIGGVKLTAIHESVVKRRKAELQLLRYELFVDARREARHGTTLGTIV
jgi:hypothetical protein